MDFLYIFLRYFFETEYLHFGYWEKGLDLKFANIKKAQQRYVDELFKLIPDDVTTMLDVGCGSGEMVKELTNKGYKLDAVCPPSILSSYAKEKISGESDLFECKFEDLEIDREYDLVYFSESFQFVDMKQVFEQCRRYSKKYVLIADVFKKDMPERGPIGGGKDYDEFLQYLDDLNFVQSKNMDVTKYIAPGFDLEADAIENFVKPMLKVFDRIIAIKNSILIKSLLFTNRKKLDEIKHKYLENTARNSSSFIEYKTYRFILLKIGD